MLKKIHAPGSKLLKVIFAANVEKNITLNLKQKGVTDK